jgi:hypothetical protein
MYKIIGADNKEYGPVSLETLKQWINEGRANGRTLVMVEGENYWRLLSSVPELAALLPGQQQYPVPPLPSSAPTTQTQKQNRMAIASFVCGLLSILLCCCCGGFPFNILGVVFGIIGLNQIKSDPTQSGKGMAIAGIILGGFSLLMMAFSTILFFVSKEFRDIIYEQHRMWRI